MGIFGNKKSKRKEYPDTHLLLLSVPVVNEFIIEYKFNYHSTFIVNGVSWVSEMFGNWRNTWGGKSVSFQEELYYAKKEVEKKFKLEIKYLYPDCNCVLDFKINFKPINLNRGVMFSMTASGTPVIIRKGS